MTKIQLTHPEGKKAPAMDKDKYDVLSVSFLSCLQAHEGFSFDQLAAEVEKNLAATSQKITGKLEWNLFWVTLDLEAKEIIRRDKKVSPMRYYLG